MKDISSKLSFLIRREALLFILLFLLNAKAKAQLCPVVNNPVQTFCDTQLPTVSNLQVQITGVALWYSSPTSTTPLSPLTTIPVGQTDYYADSVLSLGTCPRQKVTAIVYGPPIGLNFQGVCVDQASDATVADLTASGNNIKWYSSKTGGSPLLPSAILNSNTLYYASQTNPTNTCETSRLSVYVTVGISPPPTGNPNQSFCSNPSNPPKISDLIVSSSPNTNWYDSPNSINALSSNTLLENGKNYYAASVNPPCESSERFKVNVTVLPGPNPGISNSITFCSTSSTVDLFNYLGGNPQTGGTWTLNGSPVSNFFNPAMDIPGTYTYTVIGTSLCPDASASVTVSISQTPPPTANSQSFCSADNKKVADLIPNGPNIKWYDAANEGNLYNGSEILNNGVYYVSQTINSCESTRTNVLITIYPAPNPGTSSVTEICTTHTTPVDLSPLLGPHDNGGVWTYNSNPVSGIFDPLTDPPGDYVYTVNGTAPCAPQSSTITIVFKTPPNAGTDGMANVCKTGSQVNLYDYLGGADLGGTWTFNSTPFSGIFDPSIDPPGIYSYTVNAALGCQDDVSSVEVKVQGTPNAGDDTFLTLCQDSGQINLLAVLGGSPDLNGSWDPPLPNNILDPSMYSPGIHTFTYIAPATYPCTTDDTSIVFVDIKASANPGTDAALSLCQNGDAVNLSDSLGPHDSDGTWTPTLPGGDLGTLDPKTLAPGIYEYTYVVFKAGCPSHEAKITVSIIKLPNTGTNGTAIACEGDGSMDLFTYLGTADQNGTWSPTLASGTGVFDPIVDQPGDYVYTVSGMNACADAKATITVIINPTLVLSGGTLQTDDICPLETQQINISNLTSLLDGKYSIGYSLSGVTSDSGFQEIDFINGNAKLFLDASLFYNSGTVTFSITQIAYPAGFCPSELPNIAPISFEVLPVPTPEFNENSYVFCAIKKTTLADLSINISNDVPVVWYETETGGNQLSESTILQNESTYYAAGVSNDGCENPNRVAIAVTLIECELAIPDGFSPNGDNVNDTFTIPDLADNYPNFKIEIFNRYGNIVYRGDKSTPDWDGKPNKGLKFGDSEIPTGVYFFVIEFNDSNKKPLQGRLYLSR